MSLAAASPPASLRLLDGAKSQKFVERLLPINSEKGRTVSEKTQDKRPDT